MLYQFTIYDVILDKLNEIKIDVYETMLYKKTRLLFDIWATQKHLGYLLDKFSDLEREEQGLSTLKQPIDSENLPVVEKKSYKEQYIEFLMEHGLIFLVEVKDKEILLNLIYYWLLEDVKRDKQLLDNY